MPSFLALPIGLAFPTLIGWLLLRITEGRSPVLFRVERFVAGFVLGCIFTTYVAFLTDITGIGNFSLLSMLLTQIVLLAVLGGVYMKKRSSYPDSPVPAADTHTWPLWQKILVGVLSAWLAAKLIAGFIFLMGPAYFDDTMSNWNMRGKAFFVDKELVLDINRDIGSYPQSVPLIKTWLADLHGSWSEGLVNMPHILWYLSALSLLYFALRRKTGVIGSLLGTYLLASIPLFAIHGAVAYADLFLSIAIFLAVSWLYFGAQSGGEQQLSFLRIGAIAAGLMIFTKNEALLLHLPPVLLLAAGVLLIGMKNRPGRLKVLAWYAACVGAVLVPWVLFKWANHLSFGNAKEVSGLALQWHEGVLTTILQNTFLEGNWILLPGLFFGLLLLQWKTIVRSALSIPASFVMIVILGQLPIYTLTNLYVEALNQTGYARGIIQLIPLVVLTTTLLLLPYLSTEKET